jgi:hypothetical protein
MTSEEKKKLGIVSGVKLKENKRGLQIYLEIEPDLKNDLVKIAKLENRKYKQQVLQFLKMAVQSYKKLNNL